MGRLLITFILCCEKVLHKPLLYLSHYFKVHRLEYYEHLQRVRDEGDWESWLKFFLQGVSEVAQQATTTAKNIVELREKHRSLIAAHLNSTGSAYRLLEYLYRRPIITVNGVAQVVNLNYANTNRLVTKFQELGILRQMDTHLRNRRFVYTAYLAMFADEEVLKHEPEPTSNSREDETQFLT